MTRTWHYLVVIALLMAVAIGLQVRRDRGWQTYEPTTPVMWLRTGPSIKRSLLGFDTVAADLYWIRAVVYFGRQMALEDGSKTFDLLYPMLDLVTTLDQRFKVAYRFGAIFLSEPLPQGPGRPDLAIELLERGVARSPETWEYLRDIGFVHYWHYRDFQRGAEFLERAGGIPGAPVWLKSTAASMRTQAGDRAAARMLWEQIRDSADNEILRNNADLHLAQFDAMDAIDQLGALVTRFQEALGRPPRTWQDLVAARLLRGVPADPAGTPFILDPSDGSIRVSEDSPLSPMPQGFTVTPRR